MPRYDPTTGQLETYQPGPFDSGHWVLQWGGKLPGNETWSCSLRMALTGGAVAIDDAKLTAAANAIQTYHTNASSFISSHAKLSSVKLNAVDEDGHYVTNPTNEKLIADIAGGATEAAPSYPHQVAWAITLTTGFSRGLAHKGRFYNPLPTPVIGTDGLTTAGNATSVKNTATTLLTALNAIDAGLKVAVFSRKQGAPTHRLVTGIAVGRVLDTQRRRRRKLLEQYS